MFYSKRFIKFKNLKHCFFSRKGGYSKGIYKGLNCGRGSRDNKRNVSKNLNLVSKKMQTLRKNLILMYQTHSNKVYVINKYNFKNKIKADAIITNVKNLALAVVTADCVPILVYDKENSVIACIHAGWRGAISGVIENTIFKMKKLNSKNILYASVGPCIAKDNYEVDLKFFKKFTSLKKKNKKYFVQKNSFKKLFDLRKFVSEKLKAQNVLVDHVNLDTYKDSNNFFSCRRSSHLKHSDYGRCISIIKLI